MPLNASQMALNIATCTVQYGNDAVEIVFYPDKMSSKIVAQLDENVEEFDRAFCELVNSWDVLEDDGSMTPLTPERLATFSIPFKWAAIRAIIGVVRPNSSMA